ncbi:MAG: glycosyltransferase family 2 protein [Clostridiales bacterium]|nr:glycosyltransferase family 2 protein [Clostridiales bacterium]
MISIIVPVYKVEKYLRTCVDSLLSQTYKNIEIILIEDGSPDRSDVICDEYQKKDPRVKVIHTENHGLSAARNLGLQAARGEYIGFVDSDDWIEPDMYEHLLFSLEQNHADISVCAVYNEYRKSTLPRYEVVDNVYRGNDAIGALIRGQLCNAVWNKLFKKECWDKLTFPEGIIYEDIATLYKMYKNDIIIASSSRHLYHYRARSGSLTRTKSMRGLKDYWNAVYNRYRFLCEHLTEEQVETFRESMLLQLAGAAVETWRWVYDIRKEDRDYEHLSNISGFIRDRFPRFGYRSWEKTFRVSFFFVRYVTPGSFFASHMINSLIRMTKQRKNKFEVANT